MRYRYVQFALSAQKVDDSPVCYQVGSRQQVPAAAARGRHVDGEDAQGEEDGQGGDAHCVQERHVRAQQVGRP